MMSDIVEKIKGKLLSHSGMDDWVAYGLRLAIVASSKSKDPSTKVGAVIFDDSNRIVSTGYNGFPRDLKDFEEYSVSRDVKNLWTVHAEINAILFAREGLDGCKMFVYPFPPCVNCMKVIVQSGIKEIWVGLGEGWEERVERWSVSIGEALKLAEMCGVAVHFELVDFGLGG